MLHERIQSMLQKSAYVSMHVDQSYSSSSIVRIGLKVMNPRL